MREIPLAHPSTGPSALEFAEGVRESYATTSGSEVAPPVPWLAVLSTRSVPRQGLGA
jgi:hypothetical protein